MRIILSRDSLISCLEDIGVDLYGETGMDLIAYCPFHLNRDSPALNISKHSPYPWRCWNTSCAASGSLLKMIETLKNMNPMQALRFMYKYQTDGQESRLKEILQKVDEEPYQIWPEERLEAVRIDYLEPHDVIDYMKQRGFDLVTISHFNIGYSKVKDRLVIPVRDETGALVGFSGRAIREDQEPKYWDKGLPKKHILFNLNEAKKYSEAIVVEGPLDAMKVWQAGFPNVVAIFGGGYSAQQREKLTRGFSSCIIFTDNPETDPAGAALAEKISMSFKKAGKDCFIARYPEGRKDPGEMSEEEIKQAIQEKESILRFRLRLGGIGNGT